MANPFQSVSVSGYNLNAPTDDGARTTKNKITWAKFKEKIGDPLKSALESIDDSILAAFDVAAGGVVTTAADYSVDSDDQNVVIVATQSGITLNLLSVLTAQVPFRFHYLNLSNGNIVIEGFGAETIDGQTSITVSSGGGGTIDASATTWHTHGRNYDQSVREPDGRLTLISGTPVHNAEVLAATTIYYTPYNGNGVPVLVGTSLSVKEFSELSLSLNENHVANTIYDVFAFIDSGTLRIGTGPAWNLSTAGASVRGTGAATTELERLQGIPVNKNAISIRNGATLYSVAARAGTYLGSVLIDGTAGQVTCHMTYGQSRRWGLWNAYNKKKVIIVAGDTTATWNPGVGDLRSSNNDADNSLDLIVGLAEGHLIATFHQNVSQSGNTTLTSGNTTTRSFVGIGYDSTASISGLRSHSGFGLEQAGVAGLTSQTQGARARLTNTPSIGRHTLYSLEDQNFSGITFRGGYDDMALVAEYRA